MKFSWKDIIATAAILVILLITYALLRELDWPALINWRAGSLMVFAIGLATCIFMGSKAVPEKGPWTTMATILGTLAVVLFVFGLIFNNKWLFILLTTSVSLLYVLSTVHHFVSKEAKV